MNKIFAFVKFNVCQTTILLDFTREKIYNISSYDGYKPIKHKGGTFNMAKTIKITEDGLLKLQNELEYLKTQGRTDIAEKIKVARGYGDLSENSEYDEAQNEQAKIEARKYNNINNTNYESCNILSTFNFIHPIIWSKQNP